jgi:hypothetical protein
MNIFGSEAGLVFFGLLDRFYFLCPTELLVGCEELVVVDSLVWVELDCLLERKGRAPQLALVHVDQASLVEGLVLGGVELDAEVEHFECLLDALQPGQADALAEEGFLVSVV